MEEVRNERLGETPAREQKLRVEVAPDDTAPVREFHDFPVDDGVLQAACIVGEFTAREDRVQDDARLGLLSK